MVLPGIQNFCAVRKSLPNRILSVAQSFLLFTHATLNILLTQGTDRPPPPPSCRLCTAFGNPSNASFLQIMAPPVAYGQVCVERVHGALFLG